MRKATSLPHQYIPVGTLWNNATKTGNYDNNRSPIDRIVIHTMQGTMQGTIATFKNFRNQVSSNYGVGLNGDIVRFIDEDCVSYASSDYRTNARAINIENEDGYNPTTNPNAVNNPRPDALYESLSRLIADIALFYNIPLDHEHIIRHRDVITSDGRTVLARYGKTCPGNLDIERIITRAKQLTTPAAPENATMIQVASNVFENLVLKSSEYDSLWSNLELPESEKAKVGSSKIALLAIQAFISNEVAKRTTISQPTQPIAPPPPPQSPAAPSVPLMQKDVRDLIKELLVALRLKKAA